MRPPSSVLHFLSTFLQYPYPLLSFIFYLLFYGTPFLFFPSFLSPFLQCPYPLLSFNFYLLFHGTPSLFFPSISISFSTVPLPSSFLHFLSPFLRYPNPLLSFIFYILFFCLADSPSFALSPSFYLSDSLTFTLKLYLFYQPVSHILLLLVILKLTDYLRAYLLAHLFPSLSIIHCLSDCLFDGISGFLSFSPSSARLCS